MVERNGNNKIALNKNKFTELIDSFLENCITEEEVEWLGSSLTEIIEINMEKKKECIQC